MLDGPLRVSVGIVNLDTKEVVKFVIERYIRDMCGELECKFFFNAR